MKKENALTHFNNAFDKKKGGMVKSLAKAQYGFTKFQGPVTQATSEKIAAEIANQPMPVAQYNTRVLADKDRTAEPYSNMKKGGSVKSKKK